ncbi:VCBS repeat-containing protein [Clostridium sp. JN-1]|uniref:VCBS repeat-containing protein n=1 Tax=Clostridium sp. JN-1 TaxID=2483110 RepID=UPI000F0B10FD|nr:VCBS repeat-containing protein [Clostridium sp. JN-1]
MSMFYPTYLCPLNNLFRGTSLIDMKFGDVTGDKIIDKVSLYGNKPDGQDSEFISNISIVIQNGHCNRTSIITPKFNEGYNPRIFLGDFNKDKIDDIKISIDSGGSGGYGVYYIYSFKNSIKQELFNFENYNNGYEYKVDYMDFYKVKVFCITLNQLFILDISYKSKEYLSQYYNKSGKLKEPVQGDVLSLGALIPIAANEKNNSYDLTAFQRIIGTYNADTLGYVQNMLTWNGEKFTSYNISVAIPQSKP